VRKREAWSTRNRGRLKLKSDENSHAKVNDRLRPGRRKKKGAV